MARRSPRGEATREQSLEALYRHCPVCGVISDGEPSIRKAVEETLPEVAHQLCHYLRHAADPIYCADCAAKKTLKKHVRGVRPVEREVEVRLSSESASVEEQVTLGYCAAIRSALTDDGRPPLEASGLKLQARLSQIAGSLDEVAEKGGSQEG